MIQHPLLIGGFLIVAYIVWRVFLEVLYEYLRAGMSLGFQKIALVYRPLSNFDALFKQSVDAHRHCYGFINSIANANPDLKMVFLRIFGVTYIHIVDIQMIKKLSFTFVTHVEKRKFLIFNDQLVRGLIYAQGETWKQSRKVLSNLFHFESLMARQNIMEEVIAQKIKGLDVKAPNLLKLGCSIGGQIVLKSLFGSEFYNVKFDTRNPYEQIHELMNDLIKQSRPILYIIRALVIGPVTSHSPFLTNDQKTVLARLLNFKQKCNQFLREQQAKYQKGQTVPPFLKAYFDLKDPRQFEEIVEQLFLFLMAGEDTTGALISVCLAYLVEYPGYSQRILEDVRSGQVHTSKELNNFISEVNRFFAPVQKSISRIVVKPFNIDGYQFKKGSILFYGYYNAMNNMKWWDSPQKFNPQRFNRPVQYPNAYTPFASGPRNCIGQHMALMQIRLALVRILQKYTLQKQGQSITTVNRGVVSVLGNQNHVSFKAK